MVLVEDLNEDEYLVDTAINQLVRSGKLERAAGLVFGTDVSLHSRVPPEGSESTLSIEEMLDELIAPLGIPAIANVPVGHGKHMATMPLGARARVDGAGKSLEVLEAAVLRGRREEARMRSRLLAGGSLLAVLVAGAIALGGPAATAQESGGDVLRIGWAPGPRRPSTRSSACNEEEYTIWALNWELLLNFDPETLEPSPGIAESWEVSRRRARRSPST